MRLALGLSLAGVVMIAVSFAGPSPLVKGETHASKVSYVKEVKPYLEAKCILCHGPKAALGGLKLDSPEGIKKGGLNGPAVKPGKPGESQMVKRMSGEGPMMPPTQKPQSKEVALISRWVKEGANFN